MAYKQCWEAAKKTAGAFVWIFLLHCLVLFAVTIIPVFSRWIILNSTSPRTLPLLPLNSNEFSLFWGGASPQHAFLACWIAADNHERSITEMQLSINIHIKCSSGKNQQARSRVRRRKQNQKRYCLSVTLEQTGFSFVLVQNRAWSANLKNAFIQPVRDPFNLHDFIQPAFNLHENNAFLPMTIFNHLISVNSWPYSGIMILAC